MIRERTTGPTKIPITPKAFTPPTLPAYALPEGMPGVSMAGLRSNHFAVPGSFT